MWKQSILASDKGFTISEFLVASFIGLIILALVTTTFISNRKLMKYDMERTALNQNLRGAMDIVGMNVRLAGENLASTFPAIEIVDGGGANSDELIIRRNLLDEVLKLCVDLTSGSADDLYFAVAGTTPGCIYSDQMQNFTSWSNYRTADGGETLAYIHDPPNDNGEFFTFDNEIDTGTEMYLERDGGTWNDNYTVGNVSAYILEEWHFYFEDNLIKVIENGDSANPINVVYGIESFNVQAEMADGSTQTTLDSTDDWTDVEAITVTLRAQDTADGRVIDRTLEASFFPRNVLSN